MLSVCYIADCDTRSYNSLGQLTQIGDSTEQWHFVYPSERMTPPSKDTCWRRSMQPRLAKAGFGWANFLVMSRTQANLRRALGVDGKLVADQFGQSLDVNQSLYTQSPLESRLAIVNRLDKSLLAMQTEHKRNIG